MSPRSSPACMSPCTLILVSLFFFHLSPQARNLWKLTCLMLDLGTVTATRRYAAVTNDQHNSAYSAEIWSPVTIYIHNLKLWRNTEMLKCSLLGTPYRSLPLDLGLRSVIVIWIYIRQKETRQKIIRISKVLSVVLFLPQHSKRKLVVNVISERSCKYF